MQLNIGKGYLFGSLELDKKIKRYSNLNLKKKQRIIWGRVEIVNSRNIKSVYDYLNNSLKALSQCMDLL